MKRASVESLASSSAASPPDDAETVEQLYYEQLKQSQARLTANIRNCAAALLDGAEQGAGFEGQVSDAIEWLARVVRE